MADELTVEVGLDVGQGDLDAAVQSYLSDIQAGLSDALDMGDLAKAPAEMLDAMRELKSLASDIKSDFKDMADYMKDIRESASSVRLTMGGQTAAGAGGGGAGGGGGGLGGIMGALGPWGAIAGLVAGLAPMALGGGMLLGGLTGGLSMGAGNTAGVWQHFMGGMGGPFEGAGGPAGRIAGGIVGRVAEAIGIDPRYSEGQRRMTDDDAARLYGAARGLVSSIGQGPVSMIANVAGGGEGAVWGRGVGARLGRELGVGETVGGAVGTELGRNVVAGMTERYLQEGMQRYPQYLQTMASMQSVAQYGGNLRQIRQAGAVGMGYGPGQIGPEFSALLQGYGGGPLTSDTLRTSMAYARRYGVGLGEQGAAMGGLLMAGGGSGQFSAEQRQSLTERIMTDAVSAGFGRQLPRFASAVGQSMSVVMGGPSLVTEAEIPGLASEMSRMTRMVMGRYGVGTEGAGRMVNAVAGTGGGALRNMMFGGGDDWGNALLWQTNRERFGNDPWQMMQGMAEWQRDPFGEQGMQFLAGPLQQIIQSSGGNEFAMAQGVTRFFQSQGQEIPFEMLEQIVERGSGVFAQADAEGRDMTQEEMLQALLGIDTSQVDEAELTRDTIETVNREGQEIMREQLGFMRASAGFEAQQLAISATMARHAQEAWRQQLEYAQITAGILRDSAVGQQIDVLQSLTGDALTALREGGGQAAIDALISGAIRTAMEGYTPTGETGGADRPAQIQNLREQQGLIQEISGQVTGVLSNILGGVNELARGAIPGVGRRGR